MNTSDFIAKALIHPLHGLITLRNLSVSINKQPGHFIPWYNNTVSKILSLKCLHSITMNTLPVNDTENLGIHFFTRLYSSKHLQSFRVQSMCDSMEKLSLLEICPP